MADEMLPMTNNDCLMAFVIIAAIGFAAEEVVRGPAGIEFRGKLVFIFVEFSSRFCLDGGLA
jgi:hypothetical protein